MTHVTQGKTTPTQSPQTAPLDRIAMGLPASAASAVHHAALAEEAAKPNLQKLSVASRTIIWSLIEQLRVSLMPLFHGLHRCFAVQC